MLQNNTQSPFIREDDLLEGSMKVKFKFMILTHTNVGTLENQRTWLQAAPGIDLPGGRPRRPIEVNKFQGVCVF